MNRPLITRPHVQPARGGGTSSVRALEEQTERWLVDVLDREDAARSADRLDQLEHVFEDAGGWVGDRANAGGVVVAVYAMGTVAEWADDQMLGVSDDGTMAGEDRVQFEAERRVG